MEHLLVGRHYMQVNLTGNTSWNTSTPVVDLTIATVDNENLDELDITKPKPQQAPPASTFKTREALQSLVIIKNDRSPEISRCNVYPGIPLKVLPPFQPDVPEFDVSKLRSQPFTSRRSLVTRILLRPSKNTSSPAQSLPTKS